MTARELIKALLDYPPDTTILVERYSDFGDAKIYHKKVYRQIGAEFWSQSDDGKIPFGVSTVSGVIDAIFLGPE